MNLKKHIAFDYKQIGVFIFFILNCILTAAPLMNAFSENNKYSESPGNLSHNPDTAEPEDNSRANYLEDQQGYPISATGKQSATHRSKTRGNDSFLINNADEVVSDHYFASSSFLVRPAYYTFLSLYKLF